MAALQKTFIAAAFLMLFITSAASFFSCDDGWVKSSESKSCLMYVNDHKSWHQARTECHTLGADLVKVVNSKMNTFLHKFIESKVPLNFSRGLWWIGLHDPSKTGEFHWLDEKKKTQFTDWRPGHPIVTYYNKCTSMEYYSNIRTEKWNFDGARCLDRHSYICEKVGASCGNGWLKSTESKSCLMYVSDRKSWPRARTDCLKLGGDLVKIVNSKMKKIIYKFIEGIVYLNFTRGLWWIRLNNTSRKGEFPWFSNTKKPLITDWHPGQPPIHFTKKCTAMEFYTHIRKEKWNWDDTWCGERHSFICEKAAECYNGTHGKDCSLTCSEHCKGEDNPCDNVDGTCDLGCDPGYQGALCTEECDSGTYGKNCSLTCSEHCKGEYNSCNNVDGSCDQGCDPGYQGALCTEECDKGTYGKDCSLTCSEHCKGEYNSCNNVDGTCDQGCDPGFRGVLCTQAIIKNVHVGRAQENSTSEPSKLNVALIVVGLVVAVLVIAGFLVYRYRKSHQPRKYSNLEADNILGFTELRSDS
ncbi:multiple epidermal growth factor-like domains 10 [Elysia marginata]|uniref:Multiple epidermal growth factor-like domains 10 n=1 Tax=Elysia marginata TaxID=1093978 RepID=A0AAV4HQK9_9GAST|nr:multiple epidermal growth factor-like domains 10 [Elysia marginata]